MIVILFYDIVNIITIYFIKMPRKTNDAKRKHQWMVSLNKKRQKGINIRTENEATMPPPITPDATINEKRNEIGLTGCNKNTHVSTFQRELNALRKPATREYAVRMKDSGNRIVHWDSLCSMISENLVCKVCGGDIKLSDHTTGIATEINLSCKCCDMKKKNLVRQTNYREQKFRKNSSESFAINCQFIIGLMQIGGGASEAGVILAFLDLPHSSTFQRHTFARVQLAIRNEIKKITDKSMSDARDEEVRKTVGEEQFLKWKDKETNPKEVPLTVSFDMGWNKRSSGTKYDSISGHSFLLGSQTKKIINHQCLSKVCSKCEIAKLNNVPPIDHECPRNHEGSSKSMECEAIFRMTKQSFYDHKYHISVIISDDDSTMKSNLKHSFTKLIEAKKMELVNWPKTPSGAKKKDNGRLPIEIPEPRFLADFNHRVKTVGKSVYELAKLPKKSSLVDKALAARMKLYWATMLKQIRNLDWEKEKDLIQKRVLAPVEHCFDNHENCSSEWCYVLKARNEGKQYAPDDNKPLFDKTKNKKMYDQLLNAVSRFQTEQAIRECLHKFDTNQNESLNMSVARQVPKFKHFGTTVTLDSRVRNVIGVHNMGYDAYYLTLLYNLGCIESKNDLETRIITQCIGRIYKTKQDNRQMKQDNDYKRRRKHGRQAKTKQQVYEERVDRAQNLGTYQTGIAMVDEEQQQTRQSSNTGSRANTPNKEKVCNKCGEKGHATWRAKACRRHSEYELTQKQKKRKQQQNNDDTNLKQPANKADKVSGGRKEDEVASGTVVGGSGGAAVAPTGTSSANAVPSFIFENENEAADALLQMCISVKENKNSKKAQTTVPQAHLVTGYTEDTEIDTDVNSSTKMNAQVQYLPASTSIHKNSEHVGTQHENVPLPSSVQTNNILGSTAVQNTQDHKTSTSDSSIDEEGNVQLYVENSEKEGSVHSEMKNFECDNSELSFFSCNSSVQYSDDEAL